MYRRLKARPGLVAGAAFLMAIGITIAFLARTARADPEPIDIALGVDYLDASGTLRLDLPADFFAPGSVAFQANIDVERAAFGTRGPYESGTTNLILRRRTEIALSAAAPEQDILADAVCLSLVGAEPITVATSTGPQEWDVAVTLADLPRFTYSEFVLNLTGASQGTFSAELVVAPRVIFTRGAETRIFTFPPLVLIENEGTWTSIDGSVTEPLAVSGLPLGLALTANFVSADFTLAVAPAAVDQFRPGPTSVDPTATVDPAVGSLGRFCTLGPMVTVAAGAVIGPHATIQNGAVIGPNAVIGEGVTIGPGASIGADCIVGADSIVRTAATLGQGAVISSNVDVGQSCVVGPATRVGHDATLGDGAYVNGGCIVEWEVDIGAGATVQSDVIISFGASIASGVTQSAWLRRCWCGAEGWLLVDVPSEDGPDIMVVADHNTDAGSSINLCPDDKPTELKVKGGLQPEGSDSKDFDKIEALKDDVGNGSAPEKNGGTQGNYDKGPNGRHCGWYAEHLRRRLEAETCPGPGPGDPPQAKYSTSFTTVDKLNPKWKKDGSTPHENKWLPGHAYTDVHWPDGSVTWIEAQLPGEGDGEGRPPGVDNDDTKPMDGDGDGDKEVWDLRDGEKTPDEPSDGDTRTCVFASRAQATAAGSGTGGKSND